MQKKYQIHSKSRNISNIKLEVLLYNFDTHCNTLVERQQFKRTVVTQ